MLFDPFIQKQKEQPRWQIPIFRFGIGILSRAPFILPFYLLSFFINHGIKLRDIIVFSIFWFIGAIIFVFEQK